MDMQNKAVLIVLLAASLFAISVNSGAEGLGGNKDLESRETTYSIQSSSEGIGADQQDAVTKATKLIEQNQLASADTLLDSVLGHFADLMKDSSQSYFSFRDNKDYQQFLKERHAKQGNKITRVNDSFTQALQLKAYIASSRQQWDQAMGYLDRKISYAPYEAQPHIEKGYILTAQGKPQQGFDSYKRAYALALEHNAAKQEQAAALRGMGSAQIELGNLDEAVDLFNKSLEIEPGNKVALSELQYIEKMKTKRR